MKQIVLKRNFTKEDSIEETFISSENKLNLFHKDRMNIIGSIDGWKLSSVMLFIDFFSSKEEYKFEITYEKWNKNLEYIYQNVRVDLVSDHLFDVSLINSLVKDNKIIDLLKLLSSYSLEQKHKLLNFFIDDNTETLDLINKAKNSNLIEINDLLTFLIMNRLVYKGNVLL